MLRLQPQAAASQSIEMKGGGYEHEGEGGDEEGGR